MRVETIQLKRVCHSVIGLAFCVLQMFSQTASVTTENANLRGTASTSGKVVVTLPRGTIVDVIQQRGAWYLVQAPEFAGWIHGNTIKLSGVVTTLEQTEVPQIEVVPQQPRTVVIQTPRTRAIPNTDRTYIRGPRGGCYYLSSSGRKVYVDRNLCE